VRLEVDMDKSDRFSLFVRAMEEAAPVATFLEARLLLEATLNRLEDRYAAVPYNPDRWRDDGRLYPPSDDYERASGIDGVRLFRSRGHRVSIGFQGAIRIVALDGTVALDKLGKDGGHCPA